MLIYGARDRRVVRGAARVRDRSARRRRRDPVLGAASGARRVGRVARRAQGPARRAVRRARGARLRAVPRRRPRAVARARGAVRGRGGVEQGAVGVRAREPGGPRARAAGAAGERAARLAGLGVIAAAALAAFVPVRDGRARPRGRQRGARRARRRASSTRSGCTASTSRISMLAVRNAVSYPIATAGPSTFDVVLGAVALLGAIALARARQAGSCAPARSSGSSGFIPLCRLVLPVRGVVLADRYLLVPSLGLALVAARALT